MIAIVDYGVGNLFSLSSSVRSLGAEVRVTRDAADLRAADHILLPGVGAFADAMAKLEATGLVPILREETQKKPLLGICLGMQLLFEKSCEYGEHRGLGLIPGEVCPLADDLTDPALKVPHIGWNAMDIVPGREADPLFKYVKNGEYVYYVHSYYAKNCAASTLATSDYSIPVTGAWSRVSTLKDCRTWPIPSRWRGTTTPPARTSWCSTILPPASRGAGCSPIFCAGSQARFLSR